MKIVASQIFGSLVGAFAAAAALAHHSNAMFDRSTEVTVTGTVREFQWTNPHTFIELTVTGPNGPYNYSIEGPTPGVMRTHGWKFNTLKPGDKVVVRVHPLKGGRVGGGLISITRDGVVVGNGPVARGYETEK